MTLKFNGSVLELLWTCEECGEKNINTDHCQFCGCVKPTDEESVEQE